MTRKSTTPDDNQALEYERIQLEHWSDVLSRGLQTPPQRAKIAAYLRRLAGSPDELIQAIVDSRKPRRKRGRPTETRRRNWKMALDYEETCKRTVRAKLAEAEVLKAWNVGRSVLHDAVAECHKSSSWVTWAKATRDDHGYDLAVPADELDEVSQELSLYLRDPDN